MEEGIFRMFLHGLNVYLRRRIFPDDFLSLMIDDRSVNVRCVEF